MFRWWRNLSVVKKLYAVVGLMALMVAGELLTLLFAVHTLSSIRAFMVGESLWSKAQKDAVLSLYRYAMTGDEAHFQRFGNRLKVVEEATRFRQEITKSKPRRDVLRENIKEIGLGAEEIPDLINLFLRFRNFHNVHQALEIWRESDEQIDELRVTAKQLHQLVAGGHEVKDPRMLAALEKLDTLNSQLTEMGYSFFKVLGEGSRWMEGVLILLMVLVVLTVESTGLIFTFSFSRNLSSSLKSLVKTANEVGRGNFSQTVPVKSKDELGQVASAINKMASDLKISVGKRIRAENDSLTKTMFLANVSHEIRTPLGIILGLAEILKNPELTWLERNKHLETIDRTGKNLSKIINDILDISKVEAGHLEIEKTLFSLPEFMMNTEAMLQMKARETGNVLRFEADESAPKMVYTDKLRLRQILLNLVNNALKFTDHGEVVVHYAMKGTNVRFEVKDNGLGIPIEYQEYLFKPFAQVDGSSSTLHRGTGLGLVLSKRLAQALGGDVELKESRYEEGSTFVATIESDLRYASLSASKASDRQLMKSGKDLEGKKILIVDDDLDNQSLFEAFLEKHQIQYDSARNGEEAIAKAMSGHFDLVLMDMQMPVMDGYTAAKQLRARGFDKPIIAVTAHAMKEDRSRCMVAGCDDYLAKPLESAQLVGTISRFL